MELGPKTESHDGSLQLDMAYCCRRRRHRHSENSILRVLGENELATTSLFGEFFAWLPPRYGFAFFIAASCFFLLTLFTDCG